MGLTPSERLRYEEGLQRLSLELQEEQRARAAAEARADALEAELEDARAWAAHGAVPVVTGTVVDEATTVRADPS